jgi:hypothetical protein
MARATSPACDLYRLAGELDAMVAEIRTATGAHDWRTVREHAGEVLAIGEAIIDATATWLRGSRPGPSRFTQPTPTSWS